MCQHPGQREPRFRGRPIVVLTVLEIRIVSDCVSPHNVERNPLTAEPRRCREHHACAHAIWIFNCPRNDLETTKGAPHRCTSALHADEVQQAPLNFYHVAHGHHREVGAKGASGFWVHEVGSRRSSTASEYVGADYKETIGVDRLSRPDHDLPPPRFIVSIMPRDMGISAERMADQNGISSAGIERSVCLVTNRDVGESPATL